MNSSKRRALQWLGSSIAIAGIVFVGLRLRTYGAQVDLSTFQAMTAFVVLGSTLVYGLANGLLALAWWKLLAYFGSGPDRSAAVRIYGLSLLAKYVPGNILHLAGRQAMGVAQGLGGWSLAKSSLWELGLISSAGMLFFFLVLPNFLPLFKIWMATACFVAVLTVAALGLRRIFSPLIATAFRFYMLFLLVSGMVFAALAMSVAEPGSVSVVKVLTLCAAFNLAWVIGLITPGAPAGIGVREMVLIALLGGLLPEADILLSVLLSRAVTIFGDILFFLFCLGTAKKDRRDSPL